LAAALPHNHTLTSLDLRDNHIGDQFNAQIEQLLAAHHAQWPAMPQQPQPATQPAAAEPKPNPAAAPEQAFRRACQYRDGAGVRPHAAAAVALFLRAALAGHVPAQYALAACYKDGRGAPCNRLGAAFWLLSAGHHKGEGGADEVTRVWVAFCQLDVSTAELMQLAQHALAATTAALLEGGMADDRPTEAMATAVSYDSSDALLDLPWQLLASPAGAHTLCVQCVCSREPYHAEAQFQLGQAYAAGRGVPQSWPTAVAHFQLGAERNHAPAQLMMARCYQHGQGVRPNMPRARQLLQGLAASLPAAAEALAALPPRVAPQHRGPLAELQPPTAAAGDVPALWPRLAAAAAVDPKALYSLVPLLTTTDVLETAASTPDGRLAALVTATVQATSDTCSYVARALEPARLKALWAQPEAWTALRRDWAQPPSHRGFISAVHVRQATLVRHPTHWRAYQERKAHLLLARAAANGVGGGPALSSVRWHGEQDNGLPVLDAQAGEVWLYHGTSRTHVDSILQQGFRPDLYCTHEPGRGFGPLGRGTYLTDNFAKAATYVNGLVGGPGAMRTPRAVCCCAGRCWGACWPARRRTARRTTTATWQPSVATRCMRPAAFCSRGAWRNATSFACRTAPCCTRRCCLSTVATRQ
jgi:TPR repeat protein